MQYISSTDARNNFSEIIDMANREPLIIQKKGRDAAVMISVADYENIRRQNIDKLFKTADKIAKQAKARGITKSIVKEILNDVD